MGLAVEGSTRLFEITSKHSTALTTKHSPLLLDLHPSVAHTDTGCIALHPPNNSHPHTSHPQLQLHHRSHGRRSLL
jgi:hypothetical protein